MSKKRRKVRPPLVVGLGEVLWDMLPTGRLLGGAPGNVAFHAAGLGGRGAVASCIGDDDLGAEIRQRLTDAGLDTTALMTSDAAPTGTVTVELDADGTPSFTIHEDVAWDAIPFTIGLATVINQADAICFGSLAQRSPLSRSTILRAIEETEDRCLKVCDVNLRQHYYTPEILAESFALSNVVKLNDEELPIIAEQLGIEAAGEDALAAMREEFDLAMAICTCGAAGSTLMTRNETSTLKGKKVTVVDSVGAGDAFTATVAMGMLLRIDLNTIHQRAEAVARYICTQPGATPALPNELRWLAE
jgi:fructokinase